MVSFMSQPFLIPCPGSKRSRPGGEDGALGGLGQALRSSPKVMPLNKVWVQSRRAQAEIDVAPTIEETDTCCRCSKFCVPAVLGSYLVLVTCWCPEPW